MAANTAPIFGLTIAPTWIGTAMTSAETSMTAPATYVTLGTAGTNGSYLFRIFAKALGTNVQSVLRVFVNNGSTPGTAANNALIKELTLPATTTSANSALVDIELGLNLKLPAGYKILLTIGTAVSAGWICYGENSDY